MAKNRLTKLLLEDSTESSEGQNITKFGIEQITKVHEAIIEGLKNWDINLRGYDPLVEIAKIAFSTENEILKFRCHSEIARYKYPQVRALEIQAKEDKEVKVTIELAGYAKPELSEKEIEEIEIEGDVVHKEFENEIVSSKKPLNYTEFVLKQAEKKNINQ